MKLKRTLIKIIKKRTSDDDREPLPTPTSLKTFEDNRSERQRSRRHSMTSTREVKVDSDKKNKKRWSMISTGSRRIPLLREELMDAEVGIPQKLEVTKDPILEDTEKGLEQKEGNEDEAKEEKVVLEVELEKNVDETPAENHEHEQEHSEEEDPTIEEQDEGYFLDFILSGSFETTLADSDSAPHPPSTATDSDILTDSGTSEESGKGMELSNNTILTTENEEISLHEALSESPEQSFFSAQSVFEVTPPCWVEAEQIENPFSAFSQDLFYSSDTDTSYDSSGLPSRDIHLQIPHIDEYETSSSSSSESLETKIPFSIALLQRFGRTLASFDSLRQAMMRSPLAKYLRTRLQQLLIKERMAEIGALSKFQFRRLSGPMLVCKKLLAMTHLTMDRLLANFLVSNKPFLGLKGVRATVSKRRLHSPASVLQGTVVDSVLNNMRSRARLLRERAKEMPRQPVNDKDADRKRRLPRSRGRQVTKESVKRNEGSATTAENSSKGFDTNSEGERGDMRLYDEKSEGGTSSDVAQRIEVTEI